MEILDKWNKTKFTRPALVAGKQKFHHTKCKGREKMSHTLQFGYTSYLQIKSKYTE
jgi:hypothetical protein